MLKSRPLKIAFLLTGAFLFNYLFWSHWLGINVPVFSGFLLLIILLFHTQSMKRKPVIAGIFAVLVTALSFAYQASAFVFVVHFMSLFLLIGFINQDKLRSIGYALPTSLFNYFHQVPKFIKGLKSKDFNFIPVSSLWRQTKNAIIPLLFLGLFVFIFSAANPVFEGYVMDLGDWLDDIIGALFDGVSIFRLLFFVWGMTLVGWVLLKSDITRFVNKESKHSEWITRIRKGVAIKKIQQSPELVASHQWPSQNFLGLKNEYRSALILLFSVNLLLAVVNGIDINWIWIGFEYDGNMNLSQFVHEGTYFLILSIFLSMGIMLYYFRRNQNFYFKRGKLIVLATIWIAQNAIMIVSVALRNYHYINHFGLAYKRIGVIFFLGVTLFGLFTLLIKIHKRKSGFYLWRLNAWSVLAALVIYSSVYWDGVIAKYNLEHHQGYELDRDFLFSLSNGIIPILDSDLGSDLSQPRINRSSESFIYSYENRSWQSWNYVDYRAYNYLKNKNNNHENK